MPNGRACDLSLNWYFSSETGSLGLGAESSGVRKYPVRQMPPKNIQRSPKRIHGVTRVEVLNVITVLNVIKS